MKKIYMLAVFIFISLVAHGENITITTSNGMVYRDCKIFSSDSERITIIHSGGVTGIKLSELSPGLQKRFNYVPKPINETAAGKANASKQVDVREENYFSGKNGGGESIEVLVNLLKAKRDVLTDYQFEEMLKTIDGKVYIGSGVVEDVEHHNGPIKDPVTDRVLYLNYITADIVTGFEDVTLHITKSNADQLHKGDEIDFKGKLYFVTMKRHISITEVSLKKK